MSTILTALFLNLGVRFLQKCFNLIKYDIPACQEDAWKQEERRWVPPPPLLPQHKAKEERLQKRPILQNPRIPINLGNDHNQRPLKRRVVKSNNKQGQEKTLLLPPLFPPLLLLPPTPTPPALPLPTVQLQPKLDLNAVIPTIFFHSTTVPPPTNPSLIRCPALPPVTFKTQWVGWPPTPIEYIQNIWT